ncbi:unnamed protein product, partial [Acanthoscelides obtectus]
SRCEFDHSSLLTYLFSAYLLGGEYFKVFTSYYESCTSFSTWTFLRQGLLESRSLLEQKCTTLCKDIPITKLTKNWTTPIIFLLNSQNYSEEQRKEVKHKLSNLKSEIKRRWIAAHYIEDLFLKINNRWLKMTFEIPQTKSRPGRPQTSFSNILSDI